MKQRARILLVDGDHAVQKATRLVLESAGYEVSTATTGAEGLRLAEKQPPNLVLLNRVLPNMDGIEVCQRLKANPATANLSVVMMSALKTSGDDQAEGLEAGADGYIVRPMGNRELLARIEAILRTGGAEEKVRHLNQVLRAIGNINQLIARENDRNRLIQGTCDHLVESRGYHHAWLALIDEAGEVVATAAAGVSSNLPALFERLTDGETVFCMRLALAREGVQVITEPVSTCSDCPLSQEYTGRTGMAVALRHGEEVYGLLAVSVPSQFAMEEEEHTLLEEVAGDLALSLHSIKAEKRRRQVEEVIGERVKELTCLYAVGRDMQADLSLDELFGRAIKHLLPAMQFPEITVPVIEIDGKRFTTGNDIQGLSHGLQAPIRVGGEAHGHLWVYYTEERPFLMPEEQNLVNAAAEMLGMWLERKQVEEALARQEAALRGTLYSLGDAVVAANLAGHVVRMNPATEQLTGWSETEAIGQVADEVFQIVDQETHLRVENPLAQALREGTAVELTNTVLISKDGSEIPIAGSSAPITDKKGNTTGVVLVFHDQTQEHLTQRLLETRLSLIEYATHHTLDELLTRALDEVGAFVDSPIGFYHFVEPDQKTLSLQQWSTRTLEEFCQAEGKGRHYGLDQAGVWVDCVYEKKAVIHNDYASLPHKKGLPEGHAEVIRELVLPVMREDKVVAILGVGNKPTEYTQEDMEIVSYLADVTWEMVRQKRAEEALRESEERFATVTNSLQAFMYVADMETYELLFVNQFTREMFDASEGQICWQVIQAGQTGPCDFCTNKYLVKDGQPTGLYTWEFQNTVTGRWFHIQNQAIRWIDGRLVRMEVATDVTALKEAEEALQRQVAELDAFGHTVAHDLKNPLGLTTAYTDLLLEELKDSAVESEPLFHYAEIIQQTNIKMATIIDELLLLASVRAQREISLQDLDMAAIVADALKRLSAMIAEHKAEVIVDESWPAARGHAPWIEEVWINYISNALKYGGRPPRIELGATTDGSGQVRFWVRDNGPGLSREEQGRLFTQFTRLHQVRAEGHGLGLSIVRRIMDKLGGKAGVESQVGRGSEFFFILPKASG